MAKGILSNYPYILWFGFYFTLFWLIALPFAGTGEQALIIVSALYGVSILYSLSPIAEIMWRGVSGVRSLRTESEKNRLLPLFEAVYNEVLSVYPSISKRIKLYIKEDMDVNAFAFGRTTLVLTKGSIELLNDDSLKGLIAHEFGHFAHLDTHVSLIAEVGNAFMMLLMKIIRAFANIMLFIVRNKDSTYTIIFRVLYWIVNATYKTILFIGDLILMRVSRKHEFLADNFAHKCGFGRELAHVLSQIHQVSIDSPESVVEQLRSSPPPLTKRIEKLEGL